MATDEPPTSVPPLIKSTSSQVTLIPWDPDSPSHIERMIQQRIACGWKQNEVNLWRSFQKDGTMALQWVVSPPICPTVSSP